MARTIIPGLLLGLASTQAGGQVLYEDLKITPDDAAAGDVFGKRVAIDGNTAAFSAYKDDDNGNDSGSVYVYARGDDGAWAFETKLAPDDGAAWRIFGTALALDGDVIVGGCDWDNTNGTQSGSVYVFARAPGGTWAQEAKVVPADGEAEDHFGYRVAVSGSLLAATAYNDDDNGTNAGAAYVYARDGKGTWSLEAKLLADDASPWDLLGRSAAIDGDTVLVGATTHDDAGESSGAVYVFRNSNPGKGSAWFQEAKLLPDDGAAYDFFGSSVTIKGDMAVIGARQDDDNGLEAGAAYVFRRSGKGTWQQEAKLRGLEGVEYDGLGQTINIGEGENLVVVGAPSDCGACQPGNNIGSAYVFRQTAGGAWYEEAKLLASDGAVNDQFGIAVGISGNTVMIGVALDDDNGNNSGAVCVYELPGQSTGAFGACCLDGACMRTTEAQCTSAGGVFAGDESWCADVTCESPFTCLGDLNGDGAVGVADLLDLLARWGACP